MRRFVDVWKEATFTVVVLIVVSQWVVPTFLTWWGTL